MIMTAFQITMTIIYGFILCSIAFSLKINKLAYKHRVISEIIICIVCVLFTISYALDNPNLDIVSAILIFIIAEALLNLVIWQWEYYRRR